MRYAVNMSGRRAELSEKPDRRRFDTKIRHSIAESFLHDTLARLLLLRQGRAVTDKNIALVCQDWSITELWQSLRRAK